MLMNTPSVLRLPVSVSLRQVMQMLLLPMTYLRRRAAYKASISRLNDLDDRMLEDIGLSRGDIKNAVRKSLQG